MDRDTDRDRRPYPREDQYRDSRGQSYRPNRSPPREPYRANRSPPRGAPYGDSYDARPPPRGRSRSPPPFRRRSRSPPYRADAYRDRARARSPPRRDFGQEPPPYRADGPRSYRDEPAYGRRSPPRAPRDRSPLPLKRSRDVSPISSRGRVSPPPAKRERLASPPRSRYEQYPPSRNASPPRRGYSPRRDRRPSPPRGVTRDYRPASRSPVGRASRVDPRAVDNWRRRSPSPVRAPRPDVVPADNSGRESAATSRRSSPPIHPSRLAAVVIDDRSAPRPAPRDDLPPTRPAYRSRESTNMQVRSPLPRRDSPPPRDRDVRMEDAPSRAPPTGPSQGTSVRAPPTGPGGARSFAPPSGPAASMPTGPSRDSVSSKQPNTSQVVPTAPRGPAPPARSTFQRDYAPRGEVPSAPRGDFQGAPRARGGFGGAPFRGRGGFSTSYSRDFEAPASGPPSGPRGSHPPPPPFRQSTNGTTTTYPRTQRFAPNGAPIPSEPSAMNHGRGSTNPHLANLPQIVEGGQKAPDLYDRSRLEKLEEEAERIRRVIEEKQARKRKGLREWERLERESEAAEFRANLADESVRTLAGEGDMGTAF